MSDVTQAEITRVVRSKMKDNAAIITANAHAIQASSGELIAACKGTSMEEMAEALRKIVEAAIGCRARLQYMRGCWSVLKELRREDIHEGLD